LDPLLGYGSDSYWLGFFDGKPRFHTGHYFGDHALSGPNNVLLNEWHHLAATFDGQQKALYLDGELVASEIVSAPIAYAVDPVPLTIGEDTPGGIAFHGQIDEVMLFD